MRPPRPPRPPRPIAVGDPVDALCTKCRMVRRHVVVALVDGVPARVQCPRCDGIHNYRPTKPPPAERPTGGRGTPSGAVATPRPPRAPRPPSEYDLLVQALDPATAVPYDPAGAYRAGDAVTHPAFGVGLVHKVLPPDKIEVWFPGGPKRLRAAP